ASHCFFFSISRLLRALHSSPTRRSSDLRRGMPVAGVARDEALLDQRSQSAAERLAADARRSPREEAEDDPDGKRAGNAADCVRRSEEHTSELQSRVDLVCRLLLEKKKKR